MNDRIQQLLAPVSYTHLDVYKRQLFNKIKIIELLTVKNNVVRTFYFFNPVDWKAGELIKGDK